MPFPAAALKLAMPAAHPSSLGSPASPPRGALLGRLLGFGPRWLRRPPPRPIPSGAGRRTRLGLTGDLPGRPVLLGSVVENAAVILVQRPCNGLSAGVSREVKPDQSFLCVIAGRREIVADLATAPPDLRAYVAGQLSKFLARGDAEVLVAAHLMPDSDSQDRLPFVLDRIRGLIAAAT